MDGQMCEEIRIGIYARLAWAGKGYKRKDGSGSSYSFGSTLIEIAGGFKKFLEEWEEDPRF